MKRHLQCAEQQKAASNFSKYCACHAKWTSWLIRIAYETSFTMRGATGITLQLHQILRLPRKMSLMIDPYHIWNVIYNARSNSQHPSTSPNTAPADAYHIWNVIYNARSNRHHPPTSPNTAPATHNERPDWGTSQMKRHLQCAEQQATPSKLTKYCACHAKWISWLIHITYETSFTMRGATGITLQPHQILRLPRKMSLMIDPYHIWNVIYNARSNSQHPSTSPNTVPATQNESHDWSISHMKRHFQCAEQQASISNLTKYCAYHAKLHSQILEKLTENSWSGISNARPIRPRSDHDPRMIRPRKRKPQPAAPPRLLFALAGSRFYWKLQRFPLRLSFQISPHAAPATKSDTWTSPNAAPATKSDTWTSPNAAPATKSDTWTSPNAAPATESDTWTSPNAAPATKSNTWTSPNAAPATKSDTWTSPNAAPAMKSDTKWHMTTTTTTTTRTTTTRTTTTRTTTTRTTTTRTTTTRTTTTRTTTTRTTTTRTTTTRTTATRTTTTRTTTTRTTTTRTTTTRTTTTRTTTTRTTTTRTTTTKDYYY